MKCCKSGNICKLLYFETQIATFVGVSEKLLLVETRLLHLWEYLKIATFLLNVLRFLGNLLICYFRKIFLSVFVIAVTGKQ